MSTTDEELFERDLRMIRSWNYDLTLSPSNWNSVTMIWLCSDFNGKWKLAIDRALLQPRLKFQNIQDWTWMRNKKLVISQVGQWLGVNIYLRYAVHVGNGLKCNCISGWKLLNMLTLTASLYIWETRIKFQLGCAVQMEIKFIKTFYITRYLRGFLIYF